MQHYKKPANTGASGASGTGFRGSAATALGRYANTVDPPLKTQGKSSRERVRELRSERYALLATARTILHQDGKREGHVYTSKFHRTAGCCYLARGSVDVLHNAEHNAAFYAGLTTCGSVWACPVCTAKIQERRRVEIAKAMDGARAEGLQPMMVTLTFPHRRWDDLGEMLDQQAKALKLLRQGSPWRRFKDRCGYEGVVRALEVKHGKNGWHPHTHELWFVSADCDAEAVSTEISDKWHSACRRAGLLKHGDTGFSEYAVDVKGWCSNSDYLAKQDDAGNWGVDRELAKGSSKDLTGQQGIHPFGLLRRYEDGLEAGEGTEIYDRAMESRRLFGHYARTMADRRKRQLYWTPGLKKRWGIDELSDEQLAERQEHPADVIGKLLPSDWRLVRKHGEQARILDVAETGGWAAIKRLLDELSLRVSCRYTVDIQEIYEEEARDGERARQHDASSAVPSRAERSFHRELQAAGHNGSARAKEVHEAVCREARPRELQALALACTLEDAGI